MFFWRARWEHVIFADGRGETLEEAKANADAQINEEWPAGRGIYGDTSEEIGRCEYEGSDGYMEHECAECGKTYSDSDSDTESEVEGGDGTTYCSQECADNHPLPEED